MNSPCVPPMAGNTGYIYHGFPVTNGIYAALPLIEMGKAGRHTAGILNWWWRQALHWPGTEGSRPPHDRSRSRETRDKESSGDSKDNGYHGHLHFTEQSRLSMWSRKEFWVSTSDKYSDSHLLYHEKTNRYCLRCSIPDGVSRAKFFPD